MKKPAEKDPAIKAVKVHTLTLTTLELIHIRDLLGVMFPDGAVTLSEALATTENRMAVESKLWQKVADACKSSKIPIDDTAPDYVIAPTAPAPLGVFMVQSEPEEPSAVGSSLADFLDEEDKKDEEKKPERKAKSNGKHQSK